MGNAQEIPSFNATNAQKVEVLLDILSTKKAEFEEGMTEYALISQLKSPPYQLFNDNALRDSSCFIPYICLEISGVMPRWVS